LPGIAASEEIVMVFEEYARKAGRPFYSKSMKLKMDISVVCVI
jgi:hypothetical protein